MSHSKRRMPWIERYAIQYPSLKGEALYQQAAVDMLSILGCTYVTKEVDIAGGRYRVDAAGMLKNGALIYVECKFFEDACVPYVDALMQSESYADALRQPVFIGPFQGTRSIISTGKIDSGLSMLHIIAGRMNVGFLCCGDDGTVQLLLRGQVVAESFRDEIKVHSNFDNIWKYISRKGSKETKL